MEHFFHYLTHVSKFSFNKSCYIIYFVFIYCSVCCSFLRWQVVICSFIVNDGVCGNIILFCFYLSIRKQYGSIIKWIWILQFFRLFFCRMTFVRTACSIKVSASFTKWFTKFNWFCPRLLLFIFCKDKLTLLKLDIIKVSYDRSLQNPN